tara:strand:+ start:6382 stop:6645 length:264 start_codon:yes stop_codon:yes gene_type:complete
MNWQNILKLGLAEEIAEIDAQIEAQKKTKKVKCPECGSTNLKRGDKKKMSARYGTHGEAGSIICGACGNIWNTDIDYSPSHLFQNEY